MKMNPEIKEAWIGALLSDDYKQGQDNLRNAKDADGDEFCCLGVLCDLHQKMTGKGEWKQVPVLGGGTRVGYCVTDGDRSVAVLPREVQDWAGLPSSTGIDVAGEHLASMNDRGTPFKRIAEIIREYL